MTTFAITADIRESDLRASDIRKLKKVPAVVYGKTQEPISITLDASDFLRLHRKAGESNIINLKVGKKDLEVLVYQTQKHPISGNFTHIDFYAITRGEALQTKIHFNIIGESEAIKEGAIIEEHTKEVEVKCLPRNLVDHFDVDITVLKEAGDMIRISDLKLDTEKYEILTSLDDVIVSATLPKAIVADDEDTTEEVVTGSEADIAAKEAEASE